MTFDGVFFLINAFFLLFFRAVFSSEINLCFSIHSLSCASIVFARLFVTFLLLTGGDLHKARSSHYIWLCQWISYLNKLMIFVQWLLQQCFGNTEWFLSDILFYCFSTYILCFHISPQTAFREKNRKLKWMNNQRLHLSLKWL